MHLYVYTLTTHVRCGKIYINFNSELNQADTNSEIKSRNELFSEIKFNSELNQADTKKLQNQLNEIEKKAENRAFKTAVIEENFTNVKDKIIQEYSSQCPYIKHISDRTAEAIDKLNKEHGKKLSLNELKSMYNEI